MKCIVLGAGLMGKEVAKDLLQSQDVQLVSLADINFSIAEEACRQLADPRCQPLYLNAAHFKELVDELGNYDIAVNALLYTFNETVAKAAIQAETHLCDLGGHIGGSTEKVLQLHESAKQAGITIIPDLGVAPGMTNILAGHGASQLDKAESIYLRVGGIPLQPDPPLEYNHVFSMEGVLDHYTDPSLIIRHGRTSYVASLTEIETLHFERFGPLEAFHTAGGTSTIPFSFPDLNNLDYKTIRYPGHAQKMKLLVDLNLTRRDHQVQINGQWIKPRDVLLKVLEPIVHLGEKDDAVLLRVRVEGLKNGCDTICEYEMVTYRDRQRHITAMARSTACTISAVSQMIGRGDIQKRGVHPPEKIVPGQLYIEEMKKRGIFISEKISSK